MTSYPKMLRALNRNPLDPQRQDPSPSGPQCGLGALGAWVPEAVDHRLGLGFMFGSSARKNFLDPSSSPCTGRGQVIIVLDHVEAHSQPKCQSCLHGVCTKIHECITYIYIYVYLCTHISIYLNLSESICLSVYLSVYLSVHPSGCRCIRMCMCICICMCMCMYMYKYMYMYM